MSIRDWKIPIAEGSFCGRLTPQLNVYLQVGPKVYLGRRRQESDTHGFPRSDESDWPLGWSSRFFTDLDEPARVAEARSWIRRRVVQLDFLTSWNIEPSRYRSATEPEKITLVKKTDDQWRLGLSWYSPDYDCTYNDFLDLHVLTVAAEIQASQADTTKITTTVQLPVIFAERPAVKAGTDSRIFLWFPWLRTVRESLTRVERSPIPGRKLGWMIKNGHFLLEG